jgi:hypothetical protein
MLHQNLPLNQSSRSYLLASRQIHLLAIHKTIFPENYSCRRTMLFSLLHSAALAIRTFPTELTWLSLLHIVEHVSLEYCTLKYEALSYSWGCAEGDDKMYLEIGGDHLNIWPNLFDALRHLRRLDVPRVLWIDAICINQHDYLEKSEQIMLMPKVYRKAEVVQIWLGPESGHTREGMRLLNFLAGNQDIPSSITAPLSQDSYTFKDYFAIQGLKEVLAFPWFERGWVVQEAALSRKATINVGHHTLSWDAQSSFRFLKRLKFAEVTPGWRDHIQVDLRNLRELLELGARVANGISDAQESPDLLDIVHEFRHRKVTNKSDCIYSVLALARDGREFQVDYRRSTEDTYESLYHYIRLKYKDRWESHVDSSVTDRLTDAWRALFGAV